MKVCQFVRPDPKSRKLRFTRFGVYIVLISLAIGFGAMNTGNNLVYLVFGMMLGFITASGVISEMSLRGLEIDWIAPPELFAGTPCTLRLILINTKKTFPSIGLLAYTPFGKGSFLYVPKKGRAVLDIPFTPQARGRIAPGEIRIETRFPFGFFRKWLVLDSGLSFIVYPRIDMKRKFKVPQAHGEQNRTTRERGWGDTFWQIRDFFEGDNPRQISWKVSAKQARLMVRETEKETEKKVILNMDDREKWAALGAADLEDAVSFAASLIWKNFEQGSAVGLLADDFHLLPTTNRKNLGAILEYLSLFDPKAAPPLAGKPPFFPEARRILDLWNLNKA